MQVVRQVLPHASDFRRFWKETGPFEFALTSAEFPRCCWGLRSGFSVIQPGMCLKH